MNKDLESCTDSESIPSDAPDPGVLLGKLLANRKIVPASDAAIEEQKKDGDRVRVTALRREAMCPDRATRICQTQEGRWQKRSAKLEATWDGLCGQLDHEGGSTVVLFGPQGTGKTVLSVGLIRKATVALRRARYTTAMMLLAELSDAKADGRIAQELRFWSGVDVLVIDQLDKLTKADWEARLVFDVIDARHNAERVTLLVANGDDASVVDLLGASIMRRVKESGAFYGCDWERLSPH